MTSDDFRKLALDLPGALESAHMNHPDFRFAGKVFASLGYPDEHWGMVKLSPDQQRSFVDQAPSAFKPCSGAWGVRGCTNVHLPSANRRTVKAALEAALQQLILQGQRKRPRKPATPPTVAPGKGLKAAAAATRGRLIALVEALPAATTTPCGDGHLSLEVRGKRFGWYLENHHGDGRLALNCKAPPGAGAKLAKRAPEHFHVPKYLGHRGWLGFWLDVPGVDWAEVRSVLEQAYQMTAPNSPRRLSKR